MWRRLPVAAKGLLLIFVVVCIDFVFSFELYGSALRLACLFFFASVCLSHFSFFFFFNVYLVGLFFFCFVFSL